MRRALKVVFASFALLVVSTACEPEQVQQFRAAKGLPALSDEDAVRAAEYFTRIEEEIARRRRFVGTISTVDEARLGLSWRPGCPVAPRDLRLLTLSYWGMDGTERVGELIVHGWIAERMVGVFRTLWEEKFPINRMETPERWARPEDFTPGGEYIQKPPSVDTINNTYGFFCRPATGGSAWSMHSFGLAIDINPVENPYLRGSTLIPLNGDLDRRAPRNGKILRGSVPVQSMGRAGMIWGGDWRTLKDYMHFSPNGR